MTSTRDRGYEQHERLADRLGKPRYMSGYSCRPPIACTLDDGTPIRLLSTSNAGFRGIEAWVEDAQSKQRFHCDLGRIMEAL